MTLKQSLNGINLYPKFTSSEVKATTLSTGGTIVKSGFFDLQDQTFSEFFRLTNPNQPFTLMIDGNISLVRNAVFSYKRLYLRR